jgi:type VI secretion system Hcp family effector
MSFAACFTCTFSQSAKIAADNSKPNSAYMKDQVEVAAWSFGAKSPYDVATGHTSGKRQHETVKIWKIQGPADAQMFQALCHNETIKDLTLSIYRTTSKASNVGAGAAAGKNPEVLYFTIKLTNAQVVEFRTRTGYGEVDGASSAKHTGSTDTEEISFAAFSYQKIEGAFPQSSKTFADDWTL